MTIGLLGILLGGEQALDDITSYIVQCLFTAAAVVEGVRVQAVGPVLVHPWFGRLSP